MSPSILGELDDGGVQFESPTSKPEKAEDREPGTRKDGEAMPPDSLDPKEGAPAGSRRVRPESEKWTGQSPPEDLDL